MKGSKTFKITKSPVKFCFIVSVQLFIASNAWVALPQSRLNCRLRGRSTPIRTTTSSNSRFTPFDSISLSFLPVSSFIMASEEAASSSSSTWLASALGYLVGFFSLMLYTPIAIRLFRQKTADGTTMSVWMMKLSSYTCTDLYSMWKGYPISTYIETLIITLEAGIILSLVTKYQKRFSEMGLFLSGYFTLSAYLYFFAPPEVIALGQLSATALNSGALLPQFWLNYQQRTKGDYSPITAGLAATGCAIRLYTIQQLANNDPILLLSFGVAFVLNTCLFLQIVYYGVVVEGLTLGQVFRADMVASHAAQDHPAVEYSQVPRADGTNPESILPIQSRLDVLEYVSDQLATVTSPTTKQEHRQ